MRKYLVFKSTHHLGMKRIALSSSWPQGAVRKKNIAYQVGKKIKGPKRGTNKPLWEYITQNEYLLPRKEIYYQKGREFLPPSHPNRLFHSLICDFIYTQVSQSHQCLHIRDDAEYYSIDSAYSQPIPTALHPTMPCTCIKLIRIRFSTLEVAQKIWYKALAAYHMTWRKKIKAMTEGTN